jgi:hypothetical protein
MQKEFKVNIVDSLCSLWWVTLWMWVTFYWTRSTSGSLTYFIWTFNWLLVSYFFPHLTWFKMIACFLLLLLSPHFHSLTYRECSMNVSEAKLSSKNHNWLFSCITVFLKSFGHNYFKPFIIIFITISWIIFDWKLSYVLPKWHRDNKVYIKKLIKRQSLKFVVWNHSDKEKCEQPQIFLYFTCIFVRLLLKYLQIITKLDLNRILFSIFF